MPTYTVTAPNGKTLDISGDRVPTESDLKDIFKAAGIGTEASASEKEPAFVPGTPEFIKRMGQAAIDVPIGAAKNLGRAVQMIPGVAAGTDKLFGLPAGASREAMQPSNATQTAGGYVGDAALIAATGGAEAGGPMISRTAGYVSNPTIAGRASGFAGDTIAAVRAQLSAGGPVTPEKVAKLIVEHGKDVVKAALVTAGGYSTWRAVRHLF